MACTYSVFGLSLRSSRPIPGLIAANASSCSPHVRIHIGVSPEAAKDAPTRSEELAYSSSYLDESGDPFLRVWRTGCDALLRLSYSNGMQFWLDQEGSNVWISWPDSCSFEDVATYLLGPVLGVLLRLRGTVCLHASAIALEGQSVACVGPPGAGKSTTAAILAQRGWSVVSDDVVALAEDRGAFCILPAYPYLCLWPDSVAMLYGSGDRLPRFIPQWEKRCLAVGKLGKEKIKFEQRALPLAAIYLLDQRTSNSDPNLALVSQRTAFMTLVANSYATMILNRKMRAEEFAVLGRLVASVGIRSLKVPQDGNGFQALHDLIRTEIRRAKEIGPLKRLPGRRPSIMA
jgi:hypothetical protein